MAPSFSRSTVQRLVVGLLCIASLATANVQSLCSNENTGSDFAVVTNHWQSNGRCQTTCQGTYAFAIVQYTSCWCSNYAPANTAPLSSCGVKCPGFPYEQCGDQPNGFFGYIQLSDPSGTIGAATSSSTSTTSPTSTPAAVTTVHAVSVSVQSTPTTSTTPPAYTQPTSTSTSSPTTIATSTTSAVDEVPAPAAKASETATSSASSSLSTSASASASTSAPDSATPSWTPTPVVSVITVTGQVKTLTITPTAPPAQTDLPQISHKGGFFSNPGKVAGVFIVVALAVVALAGLLLWFCLRRRRNADAIAVGSVAGGDTPQRQPSKLSQMGLLGGSSRRKPDRAPPPIQTSGWGTNNTAEKSPTDTTPVDYRSSYPRVVDQRLDPVALWNPLHDNGSHISIRSLQDNQDYSRRMLRVANPDH